MCSHFLQVTNKLLEDLIRWKSSNNLHLLTSHASEYIDEQESIQFCEAPRFSNGVDLPFKLCIL
jgi:hypothetical protein